LFIFGVEVMLHPAVKIYIWACLAVITQVLNGYFLLLFAVLLVLLASAMCTKRFFQILRRTRWIMISAFIVYAYAGSGEALWPQLGVFSPVLTGVIDGFVQLSRLLAILASLSLLLAFVNKDQLVAGLHSLAFPLSFFGKVRERIIVRLALTVHYADNIMLDRKSNWYNSIEHGLQALPVTADSMELTALRLSPGDWFAVLSATVALSGVLS
jgi:energy-coupling factor transporter transmembrane protein EcfT